MSIPLSSSFPLNQFILFFWQFIYIKLINVYEKAEEIVVGGGQRKYGVFFKGRKMQMQMQM